MPVDTKFDQQAETYDKATPIQSDVAFFLAQVLAKQIWAFNHQADKQIWLDVGCGTGKLSQAVLNEFLNTLNRNTTQNLPFSQLIGLDNSQAMLQLWQAYCIGYFEKTLNELIQTATKHSVKNKLKQNPSLPPSFQPILADMTALPFADNSMDVVISSFALHWTTPQVIAELGRVVKKGGFLGLAIPVKGSFSQVKARFPELPIYPFLPSNDWKTAIFELIEQRHGRLCFFDERQFSHTYPNLKTLLHELKQMGGAVSGQSPIKPSVLRQYLQDNSPIELDYQLLIVGMMVN